MARDHARIQVRVWNDRDWRALTPTAQHMYWTLLAQPSLTYAGVMDWWPGRLAKLAAGLTEALVYDAVEELMTARFVHLDVDTSELLIRTYVKNDGVLQRVNLGKAMGRAAEKIVSLEVRDTLMCELAKLYRDEPFLAGWQGLKELYPKDYETVISMASAIALRVET